MKKINKRYIANNRQSLNLAVKLQNDSTRTVEFNTGYGLKSEGYFLTDDPDLQKALEKDARFKKSYRLAEIDGVNIAEIEAKEAQENKSGKGIATVNEALLELVKKHYGEATEEDYLDVAAEIIAKQAVTISQQDYAIGEQRTTISKLQSKLETIDSVVDGDTPDNTTPESEETPVEETTTTEETTPESGESTGDDEVEVPASFKNAQEAKTWLIKNKGVSANSVRNKELLFKAAEELGIKMVLESDN